MNWSMVRLSHVASTRVSNVDKKSITGERRVRLCNYVDVYKNDNINSDLDFMAATATDEQIARFGLREGDTVFTKDSETADDIGIPAYVVRTIPGLVCGYHLAIARPMVEKVNPRFTYWALTSIGTSQQWEVLATGVTRVGLRSSDIGKLTLILPPLDEQQQIADFLDRETARIDTLIRKQERLIELLTERRQAVITHAVTKGLDPDAPMKDSGVKWLGEIPVGWELRPLWSMFGREKTTGFPDEELLSVYRDYGVIPKASRTDNLNKTAENRDIYQIVDSGWLVTNRMKAWQGSVGISPQRGIVSGHYIVFRPRHDELSLYLNWLLRSARYTRAHQVLSRGVRPGQAEIDNDLYRVLPILVPPLDEQREIAGFLDRETAKIDALLERTQRFIELSGERRAALISAAVTGKIDVRSESTEGAA